MTATVMEEEHQRCMDVGVDFFMTKPFSLKGLNAIFRKLIQDREKIEGIEETSRIERGEEGEGGEERGEGGEEEGGEECSLIQSILLSSKKLPGREVK